MKRRAFLAASALLPLFGMADVQAAKKSSTQKSSKKSSKQGAKSSAKQNAKQSSKSAAASSSKKKSRQEPEVLAEEMPLPESGNALQLSDDAPTQWKKYDIRSTLSLTGIDEKFSLYMPLPLAGISAWQRVFGLNWQGNFEEASIIRDPLTQLEVFRAHWPQGNAAPKVELTTEAAVQNRHFDFTRRGAVAEQTEVLRKSLRSSQHYPIDGKVHAIAQQAIGRIKDPLAQAKALYTWVVKNITYDEATEEEHIMERLGSSFITGNSAAISQTFVALCRSVGIPARSVFGLRIDRSELFRSLGATGNLIAATHCRAEFFSPGYGWVPVDPAGVTRAMREEFLTENAPNLNMLTKLLFGFWEMNWIGLNAGQDITLPGVNDPIPYLDRAVIVLANGQTIPMETKTLHAETLANVSGPQMFIHSGQP